MSDDTEKASEPDGELVMDLGRVETDTEAKQEAESGNGIEETKDFAVFVVDRPPSTDEDRRASEPGKNAPKIVDGGTGPTWEGVPYRGPVVTLKETDPPEKRPQIYQTLHTENFDMHNAEDRAAYDVILQNVQDRTARIVRELTRENTSDSWTILLTWAELYAALPAYRKQVR